MAAKPPPLELGGANEPLMDENSICPGCKLSVVDEAGGVVVAFGQSFFHVDCFRCAKCGDHVTADTNLLLLSDGSPICSNCSYSCNVCGLPILDEAIMTGDDSYHAHCFKCKVCKNRIDELVFAKTSQGIYCMDCHNARVAKSRRHAQRQKEKQEAAARAAAAGTGAEAGPSQQNGSSTPYNSSSLNSKSSRISSTSSNSGRPPSRDHASPPPTAESHNITTTTTSAASKRRSVLPSNDMLRVKDSLPTSSRPSTDPHTTPLAQAPSTLKSSISTSTAQSTGDLSSSTSTSPFESARSSPIPPPRQSLEVPSDSRSLIERRKSVDDRPLNVLFGGGSEGKGSTALQVPEQPTSRNRKRQSIDPGLSFSLSDGAPPALKSPPITTRSGTPDSLKLPRSPPATQTNGRDSPRHLSPLRDTFAGGARPPSHASGNTIYHSPPDSPALPMESVAPLALHKRTGSSSTAPENGKLSSRAHITLERVPPRSSSIAASRSLKDTHRLSPVTASAPVNGEPGTRRSSGDSAGRRSPAPSVGSARSRPTSPGYRADVPQGIDSGTETENEGGAGLASEDEGPPALPPKEERTGRAQRPRKLSLETGDQDALAPENTGPSSPEELSGDAVRRTSHATFIAPALPPIRFSMSADLSDLLRSVGGAPPRTSLDQLARLAESGHAVPTVHRETNGTGAETPKTPSTVESPQVLTPTQTPVGGNKEFPEDKTPVKSEPTSAGGWISRARSASATSAVPFDSVTPAPVGRPRGGSAATGDTLKPNGVRANGVGEARITLTAPDSTIARPLKQDKQELVTRRLQEVLADATGRGVSHVKLDLQFVQAIVDVLEQRGREVSAMKSKFDGAKRTSQQYMDGLTVAQTEYDAELKARRDAEAEVTRLRVLLSGQAARLSAMSGASRQQELQQQLSQELSQNLSGLEKEMSKLKVERDMTLAEIEELSAAKGGSDKDGSARSLSARLDKIKGEYKGELIHLVQDKEALAREIAQLKATRDVFLEETTALNARNEELAKLGSQYVRRAESNIPPPQPVPVPTLDDPVPKKSGSFDRIRPVAPGMMSMSTSSLTASTSGMTDESSVAPYAARSIDSTPVSKSKVFKWPGSKAPREHTATQSLESQRSRMNEHTFQQLSVIRFTRCDHCGEKMWGSQYRCTGCHISVHPRCLHHVQAACMQQSPADEITIQLNPLPPSMFGRDLGEQAFADSKGGSDRKVPVIVEKCIEAVEELAMDYEGIYRKTGGSGQSKAITQLFERGDYDAFDLRDADRFNDICSVTSVLKNYFRALPDPLLTYALHESFMQAAMIKDVNAKHEALLGLVNQLPHEHYETLRMLMLHLNRVMQQSEHNLMNSRNLGVVFGPTLMRSRDPTKEFSDMAGKALTIEWLVDHAETIFVVDASES